MRTFGPFGMVVGPCPHSGQLRHSRIMRSGKRRNTDRNPKPKVLVIEPDPDVRRLLAAVFAPFANVTAVEHVEAARRASLERTFDVAVLDLDTCDLDAFELDVPIVVTTTRHGFVDDSIVDLRHHATVHKPFSPAALSDLVRKLTTTMRMIVV